MLRQIVTPTAHAHSAKTQKWDEQQEGGVGGLSSLELLRQVPAHSPTSFTNHKCVSSPFVEQGEREGYEIKPQRELPGVGADRSEAAPGDCREAQLLQLVTVGT